MSEGACVCPRIGVFLLAANRLLREALARILCKRANMVISGESSHSSNVVEQVLRSEADVVVIDGANLPFRSLRFLSSIQSTNPRIQALMVSMEENENHFVQAIRAGVAGYLLRDASAADVIVAIRAVAQGEAVCPPRLCMALFQMVARQESPDLTFGLRADSGLTRRERELIPLIARGFTNKEIAKQLNLSEQTVKNHIHRVLRKLGASDRLEAVERVRVPDTHAQVG